jgi:hypothetical protein
MEQLEQRGECFGRALQAERVLSLTLLSTPQKLLPALSAPGVTLPVEQRNQTIARLQKGEKLREEQDFLETSFIQLFAARQEPFPDRLKADEQVRQRVTEAADKKLAIIQVLLPGLAGRTATEAECLARLRLGRTAIALEQFRAARGAQYPVTLSELIPTTLTDTPTDPFDGQPLRYQRKAAGYRLYSIGPDLKDGAGEPKNGSGGGIVFHVIAAPRADEK